MTPFAQYVLEHEGADTFDVRLLSDIRARFGDEAQEVAATIEGRRKLRQKVPAWYAEPELRFPVRLGIEQASSAPAAFFKASLVDSTWCVADLTGGLGVDAWAFSLRAREVLYNERDATLAAAARHNFDRLGRGNIHVRCSELLPGSLESVLDGFRPDVIYLDPARRSASGRKVFRLKDCSPDILPLKEELLAHSPRVLLKLSPMADITQVSRELGQGLKTVWCVAAGEECKELLLLLERSWNGPYGLYCVQAEGEVPSILEMDPLEGYSPSDVLLDDEQAILALAGRTLFVPGGALSKAGCPGAFCERMGWRRLGRSTHLFIGEEGEAASFGKSYRIRSVLPLSGEGLRQASLTCPKADVTARNIPFTSDALRKRLGVGEGVGSHIFGVRIDTAAGTSGNWLLLTERQ